MKLVKTFFPTGLIVGVVIHGIATSGRAAPLSPELSSFITAKEKQARKLAEELDIRVASDVWAFFRTAQSGNVPAITNAFDRLKKRSSQYEGSKDDPTVGTAVWQPVMEVEIAIEGLADGDPKYSLAFGRGVISSIPRGAIYFGGTDCGRGLVTALSKSHEGADPFFTLTQNALADGRYLEYLRFMYGSRIRIPSTNDSAAAFQEYLEDAQKRLEHDQTFPKEPPQIKPGEDIKIVNDRVQVSGQVAVMAINGLIVKTIFEANPDREFYIEESFPLDWMYPYLSPYELILKLNRKPLDELSEETVKKDREFWLKQQKTMIGDWLKSETTVREVCDFARKVYGRKDFSNYNGDRGFITNDYATKMFSKTRSSIGGVYQWRANNPKSPAEKKRMTEEADLAFRQAFAFCPISPEAVFRYVNLLLADGRIEDAQRIAMTAQILEPDNKQVEDLAKRLQEMNKTGPAK